VPRAINIACQDPVLLAPVLLIQTTSWRDLSPCSLTWNTSTFCQWVAGSEAVVFRCVHPQNTACQPPGEPFAASLDQEHISFAVFFSAGASKGGGAILETAPARDFSLTRPKQTRKIPDKDIPDWMHAALVVFR
jgi:hypothetical protein